MHFPYTELGVSWLAVLLPFFLKIPEEVKGSATAVRSSLTHLPDNIPKDYG